MVSNPGRKYFSYLLWPFSLFYRLAAGFRNMLFDLHILKSREFNIPVISVGNLSAGGTGKTPFVEYLVTVLGNNFNIATLSRGYKRKTKNFIIADSNSTTEQIGDEPLQLKKKFPEITVAVDRERVHGIEQLVEGDPMLKVILLDDAYQHRYVKPGLSILLMDYSKPVSEDHYLPFGRLRENPAEKKRAHIVVVTKCPSNMKPIDQRIILKDLRLYAYQRIFFSTIRYLEMVPVFDLKETPLTKESCKLNKYNILIVTGIADPRPFRKYIRGISPRIKEIRFKDHHNFSSQDMKSIEQTYNEIENENKLIITTEKDSIRFQKFHNIADEFKKAWYFIPIEIEFLNNEENSFNNYIINYVTKNRRNNILSSGKN